MNEIVRKNGYKETELGLIPKEWEIKELGDYCSVLSGYAFKSKDFSKNGKPIIKIGNLQNRTVIIEENNSFFPEKEVSDNLSKYILKENDILIALTGATTGKIAIVPKICNGSLLNQRVGKFNFFNDNLYKTFSAFYFLTNDFQRNIKGNIMKSAQGNISPKKIEKQLIPIPPLEEQKKIAGVLSAVQDAIEKTEAVIQATKELKKSMMKHLFTYGPVPLSEKENVPLKETEIGMIPEEWNIKAFERIGIFQYGYTASAREKEIGPKILRITDIVDEFNNINWETVPFCEIDAKEFSKYSLNKGDILIARIGATTGKTCIIKNPPIAVFASYLIRLLVNKEIIKSDFAFYFTNYGEYWHQINASKEGKLKKGVNVSQLKKFLIPLPSISTQNKIAKFLSSIDTKIQAEENKKKALEDLFNSLLHNLMTAKIRVNNLDLESVEI